MLSAYITPEELERRKNDLKKLREKIDDKLGAPLRFYDQPITEERKKELKDMVV